MAIFEGIFTDIALELPTAPSQTSAGSAGVFEGILTEIPELLPAPPLSLSLDESTVANDGGTKISATGISLPDGDYEIRVGPLGSILDPVCFGGVKNPSRPNVQLLSGAMQFISPPIGIGGPYQITFKNLDTLTVNTSAPVLTVVAHDFASRVLSLRRLFPPKWKAGTRRPDFEGIPQT